MSFLSFLNRRQKEAIALFQIGTFLEYFDLMLHVHFAVLLNSIFFPTADARTSALLSALAFCSTFILRPFGALIFGYIGDHIGRKMIVIVTTIMMALSCLVMAVVPSYAQIGIAAAWIVTICRIVQGLSSLGEIIGAKIYVTELTKPPHSYPAVSLISIAADLGAMTALGVALICTSYGMNWRLAFWFGACIAIVGAIARTRLQETPDFLSFLEAKKKNTIDKSVIPCENKRRFGFLKSMIRKRVALAYFFINCGWPLSFYLTYIYFNPVLEAKFGYSKEAIISHNFLLSVVQVFCTSMWCILSYKVDPLKILKVRGVFFVIVTLLIAKKHDRKNTPPPGKLTLITPRSCTNSSRGPK